ncbi:MAG: phage tail protein [Kofleriaceae bacterium]
MPTLELPGLVVEAVVAVTTTEPLAIINRDPCPGEANVPVDSTIGLELVALGPDGIDLDATQVFLDGVLAFGGSTPSEIRAGFDGPRAVVTPGPDSLRIVLDPVTHLPSTAVVLIRVIAAAVGGSAVLDESYVFTVEDRTAPRVIAAQAYGARQVQVAFDEPVHVIDPSGFQFRPLDRPAVRVVSVGAAARGSVVHVELDWELTPDIRYEVVVTGATDLNGNASLPPFDRTSFVGYRAPRPAARRFDLWAMLPKHNRRADATGDLRRFVSCLQEVTDLLLAEVDRFPDVFDLERAPDAFLDAVLADLGNPFPFELDTPGKRRLAGVLVDMYRLKGTAVGIINAVRFFLGIEISMIRSFAGTALVLGESELGVDWELGPSSSFARYAFDVVVPVVLTSVERRQIRAIVEYLRPAHTHLVDLVEPGTPASIEHWEIGISEVGETTLLH